MAKRVLKVDPENTQLRLDIFLARNLSETSSRTFVRKLIDAGHVTVNHKIVNAHHKTVLNDEVIVDIPEDGSPVPGVLPEPVVLDIFFEDEHLLVVNKPAGMLVHPVHRVSSGTLVNALLHHSQSLSRSDNSSRPGIVHRLDRETSGLMVVARDTTTHVRLARQFERHQVRKRYVALVRGDIAFDEGVVDAPISRHPLHWEKKAVSFTDGAKPAKTSFRVLKRFQGRVTMVALFPQSGRTHQLRVHMKHLGHPILGDDKYGTKKSFPRLALHAQALAFNHPWTKRFIEFWSVLPPEFLAARWEVGEDT